MSRPRPIADALGAVRESAAPQTLLAAVQSAWTATAGDAVAAEAEPVAERDGVVTVACRSATWAQELDLMGPQLLERLRGCDPVAAAGAELEGLRFTADGARHADS